MAIVPAKTPGPRMKTSIRAQMSELTDLEDTIINNAKTLTVPCGVVFLAAQLHKQQGPPLAYK